MNFFGCKLIVIRRNIFIFVLPRKIKQYEVNFQNLTNVDLGKNGQFGNDDELRRLLNETIFVKDIKKITKFSLRHSYRFRDDAIKDLGKPPKYVLTFGEFLEVFHRMNRDLLIDRFRRLRKGK